MSEEQLVEIRRQKAQKMLSLGFDPFLVYQQGKNCISIQDICAQSEQLISTGQTVRTTGRIMSMRGQGGVRFMNLVEETSKIQLFFSRKDIEAPVYWDLLSLFDIGDIVEATGIVTRTTSGELSIKVKTVKPITKSYVSPAKTGAATVENPETKYRQRYRDLIENQESYKVFSARSSMIRAIREFMEEQGSMEVETPILTTLRSGANAKPFETHHNALDKDLYLRVAPELYLKRLLVGGFLKVHELGRLFRNEGVSTRHNPEFTAIEYYEAYATCQDLIEKTKALFGFVFQKAKKHLPAREELPFAFEEHVFQTVPMVKAVKDCLQYSSIEELWELPIEKIADLAKPFCSNEQLLKLISECNTHGKLLYALFEMLVEPNLTKLYRTADGSQSVPVFITGYPVEVSPLAKKFKIQGFKNLELTDRFELFVEGKEIANAFTELNDPDEQAQRFKEQLKNRAHGDEEAMDFDEDYIRALCYGLPSCAGLGIGIDRLVMLFTNQDCIRDVILFPTMKG